MSNAPPALSTAPLPLAATATAPAAPAARDVFAAARRIQAVVATMRARGIDAPTCDEVAALTAAILAAAAPRDPNDRRVPRLGAALDALERRIAALLAPARDPLAALKAMTEEERIALFT
jgi:hypothetical protein